MLTRLRLRNFKSWANTDDIALGPITGFFGANSSGKTSLLQALLLLKQTAEASDRRLAFHFGDESTPANLGDFASVIHGHREDAALELDLDWRGNERFRIVDRDAGHRKTVEGREIGFSVTARQAGEGSSRRVVVREMSYRVGTERGARFGLRLEEGADGYQLFTEPREFELKRSGPGRPWKILSPVKSYGFPYEVRANFENADFLLDLEFALEEQLRRLYYLGPLRASPARMYRWSGAQPRDMGRAGESVFEAILASRERGRTVFVGKRKRRRSLEEHVAHWLRDLGLIHSFAVEQLAEDRPVFEVRVQKSRKSAPVLIPDVGFGVSQILPCLVLLFYVPEGSTVILEQPEIHLHPAVQAGLGDVLIEARQNRDVQILLESHSEHLLRRIQRRVAEGQVKKDDVAFFFCEAGDRGSRLTPLPLDRDGNLTHWPEDFFGDAFGEIAAMSKAVLQRRAETAP